MAPKRPLDRDNSAADPAAKKRRKGIRVGPANLPDGPWKRKVTKIKKDLIEKAKVKKAYRKIKAEQQQETSKKPGTNPYKAKEEDKEVPRREPSSSDNDGDYGDERGGQVPEDASSDDDDDDEAPQTPDAEAVKIRGAAAAAHPDRQPRLSAAGDTAVPDDDDYDDDENPNPVPRHIRNPTPRQRRLQSRPGYFDKATAAAEKRRAESEARAAERARRTAERDRKTAERERFRRAMAKARQPGRDGKRRLGRESGLLLEKVQRMVGGEGR